jgi:hypothetical protein
MCLLPVRNGAAQLAGYFANVRAFCSGVIALDDGSADDTVSVLKAEPLVRAVLSNPARVTYKGWDDSKNRQRLLNACATFFPEWVMWLDVDERLVDYDIDRFREFTATQASPNSAYGFEILRLIGDTRHFDKNKLWVYRLFAYKPGYTLPTQRLHFEPIPTCIPRARWLRTRLRIAHLASMTAEMRQQRRRKYKEADPTNRWQTSYTQLLDPPGHCWEIKPLPRLATTLIPDHNIQLDS